MPNRMIRESLLSSEKFNSLGWFEQSTYIRLILLADDYGRLDGREMIIKSYGFPIDDKVTKSAISKAISALVKVGLLQRYEVNDKPYLLFPNWERYQRLRSKNSKCPPPIENKSMTDTCQTYDRHMTDTCPLEVEVEEEVEEKENTKEKAATDVPLESKKVETDAVKIKKMLDECTPEMKTALSHFVESRQKMRKPLTSYALELAIKKLAKLSTEENERIAIVNQTVENGWQTFYPLKKADKKPSYTHSKELPEYMNNKETSKEEASKEDIEDIAELLAAMGETS